MKFFAFASVGDSEPLDSSKWHTLAAGKLEGATGIFSENIEFPDAALRDAIRIRKGSARLRGVHADDTAPNEKRKKDKLLDMVAWDLDFFSGDARVRMVVFVNRFHEHPDNVRERTSDRRATRAAESVEHRPSRGQAKFAATWTSEKAGNSTLSGFKSRVSQFLRGSETYDIQRESRNISRGLYLATQGRSACVVALDQQLADDGGVKRLQRMVLLQCLALAYREVIDRFVDKLANTVAGIDLDRMDEESVHALRRLRIEIVRFEAAHFFERPVSNEGHHELSAVWRTFRNAFGIDERLKELQAQSAAAHDLLTAIAEKREMERRERERERVERADRRRDLVIGMAGLVVALFALFEPPFTWSQVGRLILPDAVRAAIAGGDASCSGYASWPGGVTVKTSGCPNP